MTKHHQVIELPTQATAVFAAPLWHPRKDDVHLILTGHFGRFRATLRIGQQTGPLRSKFAFSCATHLPETPQQDTAAATDFWPHRISYACDLATGKFHTLIWGTTADGTLCTIPRPPLQPATPQKNQAPRLIPIDSNTYKKLTAFL